MVGFLGFHGAFVVGFLLAVFLVIRWQWKSGSRRKEEEVMRLFVSAAEESAAAEVWTHSEQGSPLDVYHCAVCFCPSSTRCSQCKAVRYCSSKCQILHWRRSHREECRPPVTSGFQEDYNRKSESKNIGEVLTDFAFSKTGNEPNGIFSVKGIGKGGNEEMRNNSDSVDTARDISGIRHTMQKTRAISSDHADINVEDRVKSKRKGSRGLDEAGFASEYHKEKAAASLGVLQQKKYGTKKLSRYGASVETLNTNISSSNYDWIVDSDALADRRTRSLSFSGSAEPSSSTPYAQATTNSKPVLPAKVTNKVNVSSHNGLKTSIQKVVQHFRPSQPSMSFYLFGGGDEVPRKSNCKISFSYELFVKLYSCDGMELNPFGLVNCGNSCYANAVLQCLAFTRPLTSYFIRGLHSKTCRKKSWCLICEYEHLILKAKEGMSPLLPIKILSKIKKIGKNLGPGREEDAHEFLRYAVDTMQCVFLKEAGISGAFAEETTLIGLTFGGYLHSKIKCLRCHHKSERCEPMMDLTVEIGGEIGSLEEALGQFTANEVLNRENKYHCSRCKSYQKAKKRLTILEAPNILTIVLKRFQSDNFEKLNKPVQFPEVLNVAPYMSGSSDASPLYSLYAVVVHLDVMSSAFSGHYVCYIKTLTGDWFKINDSTVIQVELEAVLLEGAYMLLYARHSPKPPTSVRQSAEYHNQRSKTRNSEAIPSSHLHNRSSKTLQTDRRPARNYVNASSFQVADWRALYQDSSSSKSSSLLSVSDASSCSTTSTKDSRVEDPSEFLFGGPEPGWHLRGS